MVNPLAGKKMGDALTFKWLTGILVGLLVMVTAAWATDMRSRVSELESQHADVGRGLARQEAILFSIDQRLKRIEERQDRSLP
jgi:hypothetical protein